MANKGSYTRPLESAVRKKIDQMLINLGWNTDEESPNCNVFTERAKTTEQDKNLFGNNPDYVLYKSESDSPIAIIEAKRKGQSIDDAINYAKSKYAMPLGIKVIFAYDGAFFKSWHTDSDRELLIDGIAVTQLVTERKVLRFIEEGYSISEVRQKYKYSRTELINIFKWANNLLRKEGLREGIERFTEFANLLFLKLISEMENERDAKNETRVLDSEYCWESFSGLEGKQMMNYINDTVLPKLVKEYNHSGDVFQRELLIKNPQTLVKIVGKLSSINLIDSDSDVKGDAFEYFLKTSITVGNDLGEYFTPRHLVNLMIDLIEPMFGETVYDPTCGTGGFLIAAFNYIKRRCAWDETNIDRLKNHTIYGGELTNTAKIAKMNMIITGDGHTNIKQQDSLANPVQEAYNVVVANPPYGQSTDYGGLYPVPSSNGDAVFIQHILKSLKSNGRAAVIVPEGLLYRKGDMEKVRKYLLKNVNLIAIISLPRGIFRPYAKSNKTNIMIFEKSTKGTKSVWFYEMKADGFDLTSDQRKPVPENDIPDLMSKWADKPGSLNSWTATIESIERNKYRLIAKEYEPKNRSIRSKYELKPFSAIMKEQKGTFTVDDKEQYQRIVVKLHGKGIFERDTVSGLELDVKEQKIVRKDQFIVAAIDAKVGGYGVLPEKFDGAIVSSHYYVYDFDTSKVLPAYFDYIVRFGPYEDIIRPLANGTTNYADVRSHHILSLKFPLPSSLSEQREIVEEIERQLRLRDNSLATLKSLEDAAIDRTFFDSYPKISLRNVAKIDPKYKLTEKSTSLFVEMASVDEVSGKVTFADRDGDLTGLARFKENDIIFARITPCVENGKVAIINGIDRETGIGSTEFTVISPNLEIIDPRWLYFYLKSYDVRESAIESMVGTTGRERVPSEFFESLMVPRLDLASQKKSAIELETYNVTKTKLLETVKLTEKTIKKIVNEICQLEVRSMNEGNAEERVLTDFS